MVGAEVVGVRPSSGNKSPPPKGRRSHPVQTLAPSLPPVHAHSLSENCTLNCRKNKVKYGFHGTRNLRSFTARRTRAFYDSSTRGIPRGRGTVVTWLTGVFSATYADVATRVTDFVISAMCSEADDHTELHDPTEQQLDKRTENHSSS